MSTEKSQKLKRVLDAVPPGFLVDATWLTTHGIAYETFRDYAKNGWLERLTRGVYRRPLPPATKKEAIDWRTCLLSVQHIMHYDIHVGGMTALTLHGYEHYLRLGQKRPVWLYGDSHPKWLTKLDQNATILLRRTSLFSDRALALTAERTEAPHTPPWGWSLKLSEPERAVIEVLDELPHHERFENLDKVFEGLTTLRPRLLSTLLHSCKKIKVRRLFFVFADRHKHPWRKHLNHQDFDLGAGDRALVQGGKIHPLYRIVVPEKFALMEDFESE